MLEMTFNTAEMHWQTTREHFDASRVKVLRDDGPQQARTLVVRLEKGNRIRPHSHFGTVQHFVLEGEYESEGRIFGPGVYRLFPEHANIPEITTLFGATLLIVYDRSD